MTYMTYITYITYMTDSTYITYMTYSTYHDTTRHGMTLLHILTDGSCTHGKGKGAEEKKSRVVHIHAVRGH